jgi:ankyrin repeat protein
MMDAVKRKDQEEVKRLLDREAWRNTKTHSQIMSEIVSAAQRGRSDEFRLLLELGADVNIRAPSSHTLLMLACQGEHENIVKMLLEKGAEVNARDQGGKTALWYAAEKGDPEIIQLLLARGADALWHRKADRTALRRAANKGNMPGLKNLVEKERLRNTLPPSELGKKLLMASFKGDADGVKKMLELGAGVNVRNEFGQTPLIIAAQQGHRETTKILINSGADVKAKDNNGKSAWWWAASFKKMEVKELLEKYGAKE